LYAASEAVASLLRTRCSIAYGTAAHAGRCERELPIVWKAPDGTLIEGTIDLAFDDGARLTVVDFKTDRELSSDVERYTRQLRVYCQALGAIRNTAVAGISGAGVTGK
jgi:ATP-dependent exoDNAse (exonuclease V) beta subunit